MKKITLIIVGLILYFFTNASTQKKVEYPEVGKPFPDIILKNIEYFPKKQVNIKEFRGKWLVLDFWSLKCSSCIESFPTVNQNMKKYGQKVQFMMIGAVQGTPNESNNETVTRKTYAGYRDRLKLEMPCAFDQNLYKQFDLGQLPYIVVIDDKGIVRSITIRLFDQDLADLLDGKQPSGLYKAYRSNETREVLPFDSDKPMLTNGNGGEDTAFLFRSLLSDWKEEMKMTVPAEIGHPKWISGGMFQVVGVSLDRLYRYAYLGKDGISGMDTTFYGKYWDKPILKLRDTSLFKWDFDTRKNMFAYSLSMPPAKASKERFMEMMQRDLQNYFGYEVRVETRMMPCFKLVATPEARVKLKTKGDSKYYKGNRYHVKLINYPVSGIIPYNTFPFPVFDETGIVGNVDIECDVLKDNIEDVKRAYHELGLDFVKSEKLMKVIVIRDPKSISTQMK